MVALITPTGYRRSQLTMCAEMMKRQTYKGNVVWIIVDDCSPISTDVVPENFRDNWAIIKTFPSPSWRPGLNTQGRNMSVGINKIYENFNDSEIKAVFIIEDDDYYRPEYITEMLKRMDGYKVIGEVNTLYYNVFFRRYAANGNFQHSSLFQTAFTMDVIPIFRRCYMDKFIDAKFYQILAKKGVNLFSADNLSIGIKGMPGRPGIGAGHTRMSGMKSDPGLNYLISLIGEDAKQYGRYYGGHRV